MIKIFVYFHRKQLHFTDLEKNARLYRTKAWYAFIGGVFRAGMYLLA